MDGNYFRRNAIGIINSILIVIIAAVGWYLNSSNSKIIEKLEIENRALSHRPKIGLKDFKISNIVLERDTAWFRPKFDTPIESPDTSNVNGYIAVSTSAKFTFTFVNHSDYLANITEISIIDTATNIMLPFIKIMNPVKAPKDSVINDIIQCGYNDTLSYTVRIPKLMFTNNGNNDHFYLHVIAIYQNQFMDLFYSYFIIEGNLGPYPKILIKNRKDIAVRINTLYMKPTFIKLSLTKKYYSYLSGDDNELFLSKHDEIMNNYKRLEKLAKEKIKKNTIQ